MMDHPAASATPTTDLPPYPGVALTDILWVTNAETARAAEAVLANARVLGFDTESKPTFAKGEVSTGPHVIQLATETQVCIFATAHGQWLAPALAALAHPDCLKVGFGLESDLSRLRTRLGVEVRPVLDLARQLRRGKNTLGVKQAVALYLGQAFTKSKRISTSNWSLPRLHERQLSYAANDAQAALRVYLAWQQGLPTPP